MATASTLDLRSKTSGPAVRVDWATSANTKSAGTDVCSFPDGGVDPRRITGRWFLGSFIKRVIRRRGGEKSSPATSESSKTARVLQGKLNFCDFLHFLPCKALRTQHEWGRKFEGDSCFAVGSVEI